MKKLLLTALLTFIFTHQMFAGDGPNIWSTSLSSAGQIYSIAINPANQNIMYAGSFTTGVWKTTSSGITWTQTNTGLTNLTVQTLAISASNPNTIYCGTSQTGAGAGIYKSTDAGGTWSQINTGIVETSLGIQALAVNQTNPDIAYAAVFDGLVDSPQGFYKTTNGGTTWSPANTGMGTVKNILSIIINPLNSNELYCGTSFGVTTQMGPPHIYKTVNSAASWTDVSNGIPSLTTDNKPVRCLSISRADTSVLLAGIFLNTDSLSGMYLTTNSGGLWTRRHNGLPNLVGTLPRSCLIKPGSTKEFYVGLGNTTNSGIGVFKTTNAGISWTDFNGGTLSNTTTLRSLNIRTIGDTTLYAGGANPSATTGQGVFEYSWIITGIGNSNGNIPSEFALKQNYPNPFNPSTVISYQLPEIGLVVLKIYDINGREVKTLINESQNAGTYNVKFNGSELSSGVYYYHIVSGVFSQTKKMILVK